MNEKYTFHAKINQLFFSLKDIAGVPKLPGKHIKILQFAEMFCIKKNDSETLNNLLTKSN